MSFRAFCDFFWPTLEGWSSSELSAHRHETFDDLRAIASAPWATCAEVALDEARRLAAKEEDRRKSAEGKASTYLLMIAALIALLTYLENAVWDSKLGTAPKFMTLSILAIGVVYIAWAGLWAFRTVTVGTFCRIDATDLVRIWTESGTQLLPVLTIELLTATRRNRDAVNKKVSALKMAHEFMVRAFLAFALLVVIAAGWGVWREFYPPSPSPPALSAPQSTPSRLQPPTTNSAVGLRP